VSRFIDDALLALPHAEGPSPLVRVTLTNGDRFYFNGFIVKPAGTSSANVVIAGSIEGIGSRTLIIRDEDIYSVEVMSG